MLALSSLRECQRKRRVLPPNELLAQAPPKQISRRQALRKWKPLSQPRPSTAWSQSRRLPCPAREGRRQPPPFPQGQGLTRPQQNQPRHRHPYHSSLGLAPWRLCRHGPFAKQMRLRPFRCHCQPRLPVSLPRQSRSPCKCRLATRYKACQHRLPQQG